jgi:nucleotide-binding universal stress UspA family protein
MARRALMVVLVLAGLALGSRAAPAEEIKVETLTPRPGVTLQMLVLRADKPLASTVLFMGGDGKLGGFQPNGNPVFGGNFLVRSRSVFLSQGMTVAVVDAPSDRQEGRGLAGFRQSPGHMQDIVAVMRYLRQQAKVPVWLVGTSLGSVSVAAAAIRIREEGPDGIVLTSSVVNPAFQGSLPSHRLGEIKVPTLVVHDEKDECKDSLFKDVPPVVAAITGAPRKELITFRDGGPPKGDPCDPWGYHGYPGIESRVVIRITDWIKAAR